MMDTDLCVKSGKFGSCKKMKKGTRQKDWNRIKLPKEVEAYYAK